MLCALTVRHLRPGTFEQFREAFLRYVDPADPPPGWTRFDMVRGVEDPDEVVCFGFYDGTLEELRRDQPAAHYAEQQEAIAPFVESVGTDGFFEVIADYALAPGA